MYLYKITNIDNETVLSHSELFTIEEFNKMCTEAPIWNYIGFEKHAESTLIAYLRNKYGFKQCVFPYEFKIDSYVRSKIVKDIRERD